MNLVGYVDPPINLVQQIESLVSGSSNRRRQCFIACKEELKRELIFIILSIVLGNNVIGSERSMMLAVEVMLKCRNTVSKYKTMQ